jgi:hypothetical protein
MNEIDAIILRAIRDLLRHPNNPWQKELQVFQARAEAGEDISTEVIYLLSPNDNVRRWMDDQTDIDKSDIRIIASCQMPPGNKRVPINASYNWLCELYPECTESLPVIQEGEDPPICKLHNIVMVRGKSMG